MKTYPRFNDHGSTCKGHANWMLDVDYSNPTDRDTLIKVLDKQIASIEKEIELSTPPLD